MSEEDQIAEKDVESPCLRLCAVDGSTGFCMGCYRTLKEIAAWGRLDNGARRQILTELAQRKEKLGPIGYAAAET